MRVSSISEESDLETVTKLFFMAELVVVSPARACECGLTRKELYYAHQLLRSKRKSPYISLMCFAPGTDHTRTADPLCNFNVPMSEHLESQCCEHYRTMSIMTLFFVAILLLILGVYPVAFPPLTVMTSNATNVSSTSDVVYPREIQSICVAAFVVCFVQALGIGLDALRSRSSAWDDSGWSTFFKFVCPGAVGLCCFLSGLFLSLPALISIGFSIAGAAFAELVRLVGLWKLQRLNREVPNAELQRLLCCPFRVSSIVFCGLILPTATVVASFRYSSILCRVLLILGLGSLVLFLILVGAELYQWVRVSAQDRTFREPVFGSPVFDWLITPPRIDQPLVDARDELDRDEPDASVL